MMPPGVWRWEGRSSYGVVGWEWGARLSRGTCEASLGDVEALLGLTRPVRNCFPAASKPGG